MMTKLAQPHADAKAPAISVVSALRRRFPALFVEMGRPNSTIPWLFVVIFAIINVLAAFPESRFWRIALGVGSGAGLIVALLWRTRRCLLGYWELPVTDWVAQLDQANLSPSLYLPPPPTAGLSPLFPALKRYEERLVERIRINLGSNLRLGLTRSGQFDSPPSERVLQIQPKPHGHVRDRDRDRVQWDKGDRRPSLADDAGRVVRPLSEASGSIGEPCATAGAPSKTWDGKTDGQSYPIAPNFHAVTCDDDSTQTPREHNPDWSGHGSADGHGNGRGHPAELSVQRQLTAKLDVRTYRWMECSPGLQKLLGYSADQLKNMSLLDLLHADDHPLAHSQLAAAIRHGHAHGLVYRIRTGSGQPRALEMELGGRYDHKRHPVYLRCYVSDVTAKIRQQRMLRQRTRELSQLNQELRVTNRELADLRDRYSDLYHNAPVMYFSLDDQGCITECNRAMRETLGYTSEELLGARCLDLVASAHNTRFLEEFRASVHKEEYELVTQWEKADGRVIDVWLKGKSRIPSPDANAAGLDNRSCSQSFFQSHCVAQDITTRRRLETQLLTHNEALDLANRKLTKKNQELDEFAYVVSHDLQEPLRSLLAFSNFLLMDCSQNLDEVGREHIRQLVDASRRMKTLIHDLLDLCRAGRVAGPFQPVDLKAILTTLRADLSALVSSRHAVIEFPPQLPQLFGDSARIGQLFLNLVINGIKYNTNPVPRVEIGILPNEHKDDPSSPGASQLARYSPRDPYAHRGDFPGAAETNANPNPAASLANHPNWITLGVKDNGIGIDPKYHAKIFQMFTRLHPYGAFEGTGAGLAICQKIVHAHQGEITVESREGQGACFIVRLPTV